jgi:hypothetical protein
VTFIASTEICIAIYPEESGKETIMKDDTFSLRKQIEKWFGLAQPTSIHISRVPGTMGATTGYKCVSVSRISRPYVIVFFRHGDGSWRVYPPPMARPTLNATSRFA